MIMSVKNPQIREILGLSQYIDQIKNANISSGNSLSNHLFQCPDENKKLEQKNEIQKNLYFNINHAYEVPVKNFNNILNESYNQNNILKNVPA